MGRFTVSDHVVPFFSAPSRRRGLWGFGIGATVGLACLIAGGALTQLLGVHSNDCAAPSTTTDAPATQLYCAQEFANQRTVDDLQEAIRLVNAIPMDHPLRAAGDRRLREWAEEVLRLAENLYQEGQLEEAIAAARSIPPEAGLQDVISHHVKAWQTTWDKAETLYAKTQQAIDERQWGQGLLTARQILGLGNTHWQSVKYPELMEQLDAARGEQGSPVVAQRPGEKSLMASRPAAALRSPTKSRPRPARRPQPAADPILSGASPLPVMPATPPATNPVLPGGESGLVPPLGDTQPVDVLPKAFELPTEAAPASSRVIPVVVPAATP